MNEIPLNSSALPHRFWMNNNLWNLIRVWCCNKSNNWGIRSGCGSFCGHLAIRWMQEKKLIFLFLFFLFFFFFFFFSFFCGPGELGVSLFIRFFRLCGAGIMSGLGRGGVGIRNPKPSNHSKITEPTARRFNPQIT